MKSGEPKKINLSKMESYIKYNLSLTECICDGLLSFKCDQDYCSLNKQTCEAFRKKLKTSYLHSNSSINRCKNDFFLIEKNKIRLIDLF